MVELYRRTTGRTNIIIVRLHIYPVTFRTAASLTIYQLSVTVVSGSNYTLLVIMRY